MTENAGAVGTQPAPDATTSPRIIVLVPTPVELTALEIVKLVAVGLLAGAVVGRLIQLLRESR